MQIKTYLPKIAVGLVVSGGLFSGANFLFSTESSVVKQESVSISALETQNTPETPPDTNTTDKVEPTPQICETSESMLSMIKNERELLDQQKNKLSDEEAKIKLAQERLQIEIQNLDALKSEVTGLLDRAAAMQTADVEKLINIYQTMKPVEAAALMNDMDLEVAVMVLGTMSERKAAPILAKMSLTKAQAISKIILERAKLPGDQKLNGIKLE